MVGKSLALWGQLAVRVEPWDLFLPFVAGGLAATMRLVLLFQSGVLKYHVGLHQMLSYWAAYEGNTGLEPLNIFPIGQLLTSRCAVV